MSKYRSVGQRHVGFCLRAYWIGRDAAFGRWAVRFTDAQWGLLQDVVYELDDERAASSGRARGNQRQGDSDGDGKGDGDDEKGEDEDDEGGITATATAGSPNPALVLRV